MHSLQWSTAYIGNFGPPGEKPSYIIFFIFFLPETAVMQNKDSMWN